MEPDAENERRNEWMKKAELSILPEQEEKE
jgi:hypothetical protein